MTSAPRTALADLLGQARARVLREVQAGPVTAVDAAESLGISAAAVRRHLHAMAEDDLVRSEVEPDGGMGRPAERWRLTARGRRLFADRSAELADELLDHVAAAYGRSAVAAFLTARNERNAARYAAALDEVADPVARARSLAQALSDDGFAARVESDGDGRTLELLQTHCAIEGVATAHPEICAHEAAMFRRLLGARVTRRQTIATGADACVCRIDLTDVAGVDPEASPEAPTSDRSE